MPATLGCDRRLLLDEEVERLERAGYIVVGRDDDLGNGISRLVVVAPADKTGTSELELRIDLPSLYPFMPPLVHADGLSLPRHQHPFSKNLCLLERSTHNWDPWGHLDRLLDGQLARAIAAGMGTPLSVDDEYEQGEPYSAYYTYEPNSAVLCDLIGVSPEVGKSGGMAVSVLEAVYPTGRLIATLDEITVDGASITTELLHAMFGFEERDRIRGRWTMLESPPTTDSAEEIWRLAEQADNVLTSTGRSRSGKTLECRAVAFPEEQGPASVGTGWLFVLKEHGLAIGSRKARRSKGAQRGPDTYRLLPAYRAGREDLMYRAPETHGLESKSVLVIGCGAIGSVLVEQLARAGVGTFLLIDSDRFEPGNVSRHACGVDMAGIDKVAALAKRVWEVNPYARVNPIPATIGATLPTAGQPSEADALTSLMGSVDLVVDATAEVGVQEATSLICRSVGKDWVCVDGTPGIGGGCVVRVKADSDACFSCFCWHQYRGTIPKPPAYQAEYVQPTGCSAPTFTGTGFDIAAIALQASRVVVGALLRGVPGGYPEDGYGVHILSLRDETGTPHPPAWAGYTLERHVECQYH